MSDLRRAEQQSAELIEISVDEPEADRLAHVGEVLRGGDVVAIPTETVYGLACNALDPDAVAKVFAAKERPASDPLIVHVDGLDMADRVIDGDLPPAARKLAEAFWPGPLTKILPKHADVPDVVTSGLPDVAVRCPSHPVASAIITAAGVPLAAPSANRFSRVSPTSAQHVLADLGDRIGWIVDSGRSVHGLESTVVAFDGDGVVVLRHGAVPLEALAEIVPARTLDGASTPEAKASPGHDERHYSPRTPAVAVVAGTIGEVDSEALGALDRPGVRFAGYADRLPELPASWNFFDLGPVGAPERVAHDLYDSLRRMDTDDVDLLVLELTGVDGLGRAIDDRLTRAASSVVAEDVAALRAAIDRLGPLG